MAKYSLTDWTKATKQTNVIFFYTLIGENVRKQKGNSGFRQGTRNLDFVPPAKHPVKRIRKLSTRRYFDQGRRNWRSFRANKYGNTTAFMNPLTGVFFDTPSEAGLKGIKDK